MKVAVLNLQPPLLSLDGLEPIHKRLVVELPIHAGVHPSVTVWAKRDHISWVIRTAVTDSPSMVRLQVGDSVWCTERCCGGTSFTVPSRSRQHVAAHIGAALVNGAHRRASRQGNFGGLQCRGSQEPKRGLGFMLLISRCLDVNGVQRPQFEDKCPTLLPAPIGCYALEQFFAYPLTVKTEPAVSLLAKKEQALAVIGVGCDGFISTDHQHVANLTLAEVLEDAVRSETVAVPVLLPFRPRDCNHQRVARWCDDSSLLLTTIARVNVRSPVVSAPTLERPLGQRHRQFSPSVRRLQRSLRPSRYPRPWIIVSAMRASLADKQGGSVSKATMPLLPLAAVAKGDGG